MNESPLTQTTALTKTNTRVPRHTFFIAGMLVLAWYYFPYQGDRILLVLLLTVIFTLFCTLKFLSLGVSGWRWPYLTVIVFTLTAMFALPTGVMQSLVRLRYRVELEFKRSTFEKDIAAAKLKNNGDIDLAWHLSFDLIGDGSSAFIYYAHKVPDQNSPNNDPNNGCSFSHFQVSERFYVMHHECR